MKTKKELEELKTEIKKLDEKLKELSVDELKEVTGGNDKNGIRIGGPIDK